MKSIPNKTLTELDNKIKKYISLVERLEQNPESIRMFNEVFEQGKDFVKQYGKGMPFFGKTRFRYETLDKKQSLGIGHTYENLFLVEAIIIATGEYQKAKSEIINMGLIKERGCITAQKQEKIDALDDIIKPEPFRNFFIFEPKELTIFRENDQIIKRVEYTI